MREENLFSKFFSIFKGVSQTTTSSKNFPYFKHRGSGGFDMNNSLSVVHALDEKVIYDNMEYKNLTKQLAQAFNDMWTKCIKRYTDFFASPGESFINTNWDNYNIILKGLPISMIDTLDEHGWNLALDDWEKNHNGAQYKRNFLNKRDAQRDEMRKKSRKLLIINIGNLIQKNLLKQRKSRKKISEITKEKVSIETEKHPFDNKSDDIKKDIDEKQSRIEKLGKKIFGKKKAEEEIITIKPEIDKLKGELQEVTDKIQVYEKSISEKTAEIND